MITNSTDKRPFASKQARTHASLFDIAGQQITGECYQAAITSINPPPLSHPHIQPYKTTQT